MEQYHNLLKEKFSLPQGRLNSDRSVFCIFIFPDRIAEQKIHTYKRTHIRSNIRTFVRINIIVEYELLISDFKYNKRK